MSTKSYLVSTLGEKKGDNKVALCDFFAIFLLKLLALKYII